MKQKEFIDKKLNTKKIQDSIFILLEKDWIKKKRVRVRRRISAEGQDWSEKVGEEEEDECHG